MRPGGRAAPGASGRPATIGRRRRGGFSLVELAAACTIAGLTASIALAWYGRARAAAQEVRVQADLHTLRVEVEAYAIETGSLPSSLADLGRGDLLDPWGRPYEYRRVGPPPAEAGADRASGPLVLTSYCIGSAGPEPGRTGSGTAICPAALRKEPPGAGVGVTGGK